MKQKEDLLLSGQCIKPVRKSERISNRKGKYRKLEKNGDKGLSSVNKHK